MKKLNNKGFSLVELIIVIAIMAILVGVLAPQLIKYIEKAKVSSDTQIADTLHSAITYALADPEVLSATDDSRLWVDDFTTGDNGYGGPNEVLLYSGGYGASRLNCVFVEKVTEIAGFNPWTTDPEDMGFKSTPETGYDSPWPVAIMNRSGNGFAVYLAHSDRTGNKQGENFNGEYDELEDSKVIFVK